MTTSTTTAQDAAFFTAANTWLKLANPTSSQTRRFKSALTTWIAAAHSPTPPSIPSTPSNLSSTATSATQSTLTWSTSTGAVGYNVIRDGIAVGTSTSNVFHDAGLTNNKTYTYTVSAFNAAGNVSGLSMALVYRQSYPGSVPSVVSDGWTVFTGTARQIYVSSSTGNDSTGSGTQVAPYATIGKGATFIRTGFADQLLLKCGDTFTNQDFSGFNFSGPGMVVSPAWTQAGTHTVSGVIMLGTYGTGARPLIQSTVTFSGGAIITLAGAATFSNVAIIGWEFYSHTRDPGNGAFLSADAAAQMDAIDIFVSVSNLIIEDCKFSFFSAALAANIIPYGVNILDTLVLRRNVIVDQYRAAGAHAQGIFTAGCHNILIEDNCFDHNGWNGTIVGAEENTFNHNVYMSVPGSDGNSVIRGNIFANDGGGVQFRGGGTIYNNLFIRNASHLLSATNKSTITYNVIQEACDIPAPNTSVQGFGIGVNYGLPNTLVDNNIISNESSAAVGGDFGIRLDDASNSTTGTFSNGSNIVTAVFDGGVGSGNGGGIEGWPVGTVINCASAGLAANTVTVTARSGFNDDGAPGTLTLSANATASGTFTITRPLLTCTVSNNVIYKQAGGIQDANGSGTIQTNNANDPTGTNSGQPGEPFPAPTRTVGNYDTSLGGAGTNAHFLSLARGQSRASWNTAYMANAANNYIRAGFNKAQL